MKQILKIKNLDLKLTDEPQVSPSGRLFRLSATFINNEVPGKWINKELKHYWVYKFIFLDKKGGFINFEFDYNGNFCNHYLE